MTNNDSGAGRCSIEHPHQTSEIYLSPRSLAESLFKPIRNENNEAEMLENQDETRHDKQLHLSSSQQRSGRTSRSFSRNRNRRSVSRTPYDRRTAPKSCDKVNTDKMDKATESENKK